MIREISGTVLENTPTGSVIDVAGFGIFVHLAAAELLPLGETVRLKTYLAITQNGIDLYGFMSEPDRKFFEQLLTVSGVGPKTALSIFSKAPREALENAIATRDIAYLTRVAGMSKKAAEKIAVELSEKITAHEGGHDGIDAEVFDTLVALGYTDREARKALSLIPLHISGRDERLRAALSAK
jgi:Holliday junction DNA helicase RuvA